MGHFHNANSVCASKWAMRVWSLTAVFVFAYAPIARAGQSANQPNILIMFVDQLRWSEVGCYGNTIVRTPHLDKLASEGVRFTHAFTNFPSCSPARSTLISGRHARSNGLYANQNTPSPTGRPTNRDITLAEALAAVGYTTAIIGKWHLAPTPQILGFQKSWLGGLSKDHGYMKSFWRVYDSESGDRKFTHEGYTLEHQSELADQFLRQHRDRKFMLCLTPSPPHMPIDSLPQHYKKMYDPADMPLRLNVWKDGQLPFDEFWFKVYLWGPDSSKPLPPEINLRDLYALYYGQVTAIDDWVGRVLESLKKLQLEDNTIVLFSSDHGDLLGSHQLFNKNKHYDEACRIPLLIRWPGKIKPTVQTQQIIGLVDVMPTLLELCDTKIPNSVQGTSLAPILLGQKELVGDNIAFIETTNNEGIRTMQYLYWFNRNNFKGEHLFDVTKDHYQTNDVIDDPVYREIAAELRAKTKAWRERTPSAPPFKAPTKTRKQVTHPN